MIVFSTPSLYLFLLVSPLLPTTESACINCGGADKTSAKRFKMPNKSVFTRLAGIELMEIFEITNQKNHEVCAQRCDARAECAVFEFNLPNKLCVLASEYARLTDDLAKGAFEIIVFVKVRGAFTKALPKEKEACLDKSEYEDYVKHEVDKWLNPSPKKSTSEAGSSSAPATTTITTTGATTGASAATMASGDATTAGGTSGASTAIDSTKGATTTATSATSTTLPIGADSSEMTTSSASTPVQQASTSTDAATATYKTEEETSGVSSVVTPGNEEQGMGSSEVATQSTYITDESTTKEKTPEIGTSEDRSTQKSSPGAEESSTTPDRLDEVSTTRADSRSTETAANGIESGSEGPLGKFMIKASDGSYLRLFNSARVHMIRSPDFWSQWVFELRDKKVTIKTRNEPSRYLTAKNGSVRLVEEPNADSEFEAVKNPNGTWSFRTQSDTWISLSLYDEVTLASKAGKQEELVLESWN
ncbi:hypothetical protein PRIPAC_85425 [Pristionchus pacificus]|uniref:Apple domain-containing protein n=1 Tax=Pristionchus pacificus TaxID=54126 RepID=A0A2A6BKN6_PRIPA|nr:hypothetical protein PRIPAC_85425 [Pristionchus pacificus]|eukprot:PDM66482.1 hypothetical protein PRIPAC_47899 [Pristionchus pacificus]